MKDNLLTLLQIAANDNNSDIVICRNDQQKVKVTLAQVGKESPLQSENEISWTTSMCITQLVNRHQTHSKGVLKSELIVGQHKSLHVSSAPVNPHFWVECSYLGYLGFHFLTHFQKERR